MSNVNARRPEWANPVGWPRVSLSHPFAFLGAVAKSRQHRRDMNHLRILPDDLLKDVGPTRDDIRRELIRQRHRANRQNRARVRISNRRHKRTRQEHPFDFLRQ